MSTVNFIRAEPISLKVHPELDEKWVQELIARDPSILGLGDLVLRDKERRQQHAGRLDLLLEDADNHRRYEVEIQLGSTDESHIIRTIEYWDNERKTSRAYDHCAVIIAEDITSRFLNIISLFNGQIPLIAIQMQAMKVGDATTLVFTKVVNELTPDLDQDEPAPPTDRAYWERRGTKKTVQLADSLLAIVREIEPSIELKYNKFYIGLARNGQPFNIVIFRPRKSGINVEIKLPRDPAIDEKIEEADLSTLDYSTRWGVYRLSLSAEDVSNKRMVLADLFKLAHRNRAE